MIKAYLIGLVFFLTSSLAHAFSDNVCQPINVFEKLVNDVCWSCMLPIKIAGVDVGGSAPRGSVDAPICACNSIIPGVTYGAWFPTHIVEAVKIPGCQPSLGGIMIPLGDSSALGNSNMGAEAGDKKAFRHLHYYSFPIAEMLQLVAGCNESVSMDLLQATEVLPTWNNDLLGLVLNPETMLFANPAAVMACSAEAATTGVGGTQPIEQLFWCAGSWGTIYPLTGSIEDPTSAADTTGLQATRLIAVMHRLGQARKTMGDSCRNSIWPVLPKNQYKLQHFHPLAESTGNHWIGESSYRWGMHRKQLTNQNYLNLVWRWNDCCVEPL
ncbi:TraU family protein [Marinobacter goseongensis]|uniref:TraU family protein n=1 Tax=Marinobacter goseongensis TaxID=453838 RepID=UPI0020059E49|nr:TraU family protein [Marinobacter goseongensis]MCK7553316.1 TraU family protein [Marinobacter goseongensis]